MDRRGRLRLATLAGSVLLHAGLGLLALWIPTAPEPPPNEREPEIELVWLDDVPSPTPVRRVELPVDASPPSPPPADGSTDPAPEAAPTPSRRRPARSKGEEPSMRSEPVAPEAPAGNGLALSGFRGSSSKARGGKAPAPVVAAPAVPPKPKPKSVAPEGPALPQTDTGPRSLEEAGFRKRKDGSFRSWKLDAAVTATILPNGKIEFRERKATFKLEEWRMDYRGVVQDGAERSRKAKRDIARRTFELRLQMARTWSREQMRRELAALGRRLEQVWTREDWSAVRRRKMLFTLWDDCEEAPEGEANAKETVGATLEQARIEAGTKARKKVLAFIRDTLPADSADAYSKAELKRLNESRTSRQRFAPYGGS